MTIVEKRRKSIINITYFALLAVAYYIFVKYAFWFAAPFIFALIIAMCLQKPIRFVSEKTHIKKNIVSVVAVLLILALIVGLMVFVGYRVAVELSGFTDYVIEKMKDLPGLIKAAEGWIIERISFLPDGVETRAVETIQSFSNSVLVRIEEGAQIEQEAIAKENAIDIDLSILAGPLSGLWSTAKQIPAVLVACLVGIIACFFMTSDYDNLMKLIKNNVSAEREDALVRTKRLMIGSMGKMALSYAIIIAITCLEIFMGLNFLKLIGVYAGGYIFAISIITALLDILPVLGTGTVFIPWGLFSLFSGNFGLGIGLLVIYGVITVVRQIIEPRLVGMNLGIPPVLTLMGMYIGLQVFGVLGIFIVPLSIVLIKILNSEGIIQLWTARTAAPSAETQPAKKAKKSAAKK